MPTKCDKELAWWLSLANLYQPPLSPPAAQAANHSGFSGKVRRLAGLRPAPIEPLLTPGDPLRNQLVGWGNDPDQYLWALAGIAKSVVSNVVEAHTAAQLPKTITVPQESNFMAPLLLRLSAAGAIELAERPNPLDDLLALLQGKNAAALGICPICAQLFERLRRDQKCDNRVCRDAYRQRLFRQRHQTKIRGGSRFRRSAAGRLSP
jgi:hypothetical protein